MNNYLEVSKMENTKIAAAFVKAQKGFAPALKTSSNPHFRSKYADLSACVEAVIDSLNKEGIALIQMPHESESGVIVETIFLHESGESMSGGKLYTPASKQDPQGYGSALTYARRYGLMAACGIAPEDDDGNAASRREAFKSEPKSEWDKLDEATQNWMTEEAMAITVMLKDSDIEGAYNHMESLQLESDYKIAFWSRLDATQRSAIKAYSAILHAKDMPGLVKAWGAVPKHTQDALTEFKDRRKAELTQPEKEAA
ncbi:MAG: ERF family protein [Burkholderiales bacterium]